MRLFHDLSGLPKKTDTLVSHAQKVQDEATVLKVRITNLTNQIHKSLPKADPDIRLYTEDDALDFDDEFNSLLDC